MVADKRRGKLSLVQTLEDGLLHLQWTQRPNGQLQDTDDILLMPRSAFLEKVPECKVCGRCMRLCLQLQLWATATATATATGSDLKRVVGVGLRPVA